MSERMEEAWRGGVGWRGVRNQGGESAFVCAREFKANGFKKKVSRLTSMFIHT